MGRRRSNSQGNDVDSGRIPERRDTCSMCSGRGSWTDHTTRQTHACPVCDGKGWLWVGC